MAGENGTFKVPSLDSLEPYNVNRVGQYEGICASLYDSGTYAQAGQTSMNFFQVPVGQSSKSLEDTNMESAGQLPAGKFFFVTGIELMIYPNINPASLGAAAVQEQVNDVYNFAKRGWLNFFIGSKSYLIEAPLNKFPSRTGLIVSSSMSDATTAAAALNNRVAYANMGGRPYDLKPGILLTPNQNFSVSINWASVQALSATAKIYCNLNGYLYRQSQ